MNLARWLVHYFRVIFLPQSKQQGKFPGHPTQSQSNLPSSQSGHSLLDWQPQASQIQHGPHHATWSQRWYCWSHSSQSHNPTRWDKIGSGAYATTRLHSPLSLPLGLPALSHRKRISCSAGVQVLVRFYCFSSSDWLKSRASPAHNLTGPDLWMRLMSAMLSSGLSFSCPQSDWCRVCL